jgi:uncharacterized protein YneF (UPF0154 family)
MNTDIVMILILVGFILGLVVGMVLSRPHYIR